jgi:GNAT superfamily N-acetyltransferase
MPADTVRMEAIEAEAWADLVAAAPAAFAEATGLSATRLGDGVFAFRMNAVDHVQFNRIQGLGVSTPATRAVLETALAPYRDAGLRNVLVQVPPDARPAALGDWLAAAGLVPFRRAWAKFHRGPTPIELPASDIRIEEVGPDRREHFATVVGGGFGMPPPIGNWMATLVGRAGWRAYVGYADGAPATAGLVYRANYAAWLGAEATLPPYRGRGAQRALMARSIADAIADGCIDIVAETGEAVAGEPNHSHANMLRCGFRVAYARANYTFA